MPDTGRADASREVARGLHRSSCVRNLICCAVLVASLACDREQRSSSSPDTPVGDVSRTTTATGPVATVNGTDVTTSGSPVPAAKLERQLVHVEYTGSRMTAPAALQAGATTFHVVNSTSERHAFEVTGPGLERALMDAIEPGTFDTLDIDLVAGTYRAYCPLHISRQQESVTFEAD